LGLLCAAALSALTAIDRRAALFELATVFFIPALYYGLVRDRLRGTSPDARWRLAGAFVLGGVGVAAIGLFQYTQGTHVSIAEGGLPRLQSVYFSPNRVGLYLGRVFPLLLALTVGMKRWGGWMFYSLALGTATTALALALSFSRGALLLGVPAALLAMGIAAGGRYRRAALALVLIEALALIPLMRVPRFASLLDLQEGSTFFRLELWRSTLTLLRERPWFGVGPGNFLSAYRTRYVLPTAWQEFNLQHAHNIYLDLWASLGMLGLLAGGALLIAIGDAFISALRRRRFDSSPQACLLLGLLGSFAALLAHGLVDNTLFFPDMAIAFFLTTALFLSISRRSMQ
jgi:O-antigen ligase